MGLYLMGAKWRISLGRELPGIRSETGAYQSSVRILNQIITSDVSLAATVEEGGLKEVTESRNGPWSLHEILRQTDIPVRAMNKNRPCVIGDLTDTRGATAPGGSTPGSGPTPAGSSLRSLLVAPVGGNGILVAASQAANMFTEEQLDDVVELTTIVSGALYGLEELEGHDRPDTSRLTRIIAHDMKSPLNVAKGRMQLALDTGDLEEISRAIQAVNRIERLVDGLSLLSREHLQTESMEVVDFNDLVDEAWSSVRSREATIEVVESASIIATASLACQVLSNLFSNAVEHAGPSVCIRVGMFEDGFFVEDDGPGIPLEHRSDVFEWRFSSEPSHSGLGLAIVDQIVDAHGWDIEITDSDLGGARFDITGVERV